MPVGAVRIGTRGSALALWQARWVEQRLRRELPHREWEIVPVTTRGDVQTGAFTGAPDEIGFFTSGIEAALLEGRIDLAVHSLKDLPTSEAARLPVIAVPLRDDPADVLVSHGGRPLDGLPAGARVGTSSPRRTCLVLARRPDLIVEPIRGNVDTRVSKVRSGAYDATLLAAAGLLRLGMADVAVERFDPIEFPPAPGQGALAVQARGDDAELLAAVLAIDDAQARATADAERICLESLGGGCARPIGAHARFEGDLIVLTGVVGTPDGAKLLRVERSGASAAEVGRAVAEELRRRGADQLLG